MAHQIEAPEFANESEEARWWFEHQDVIDDEFELAAREGRLGHGRAVQRTLAAQGVQLAPEDAVLAWKQAERRGMEYGEYLKMVVHEALAREARSA